MTEIRTLARKIGKRRPDTHKGDYGHVFVIAGSLWYTGAPYLASQGALRAGSGLVTLGVPKSLHPILASRLVEVMVRPFAETKARSFDTGALGAMVRFCRDVDAVALGPGLSRDTRTQRLVRSLIAKLDAPIVLDADGINALAGHCAALRRARRRCVLTPHPGEMGRLLGRRVGSAPRERKDIALGFAKKYNVVLALKGWRTCVADPGGRWYVNTTGNPGMASGGMGDVLTGMIAGFIAQGLDAYEASVLAVHVHGRAGDLAAKEKGPVGLTATDLLRRIPAAIKALT